MKRIISILTTFSIILSFCACGRQDELSLPAPETSENENPFVIGGGSETIMLGYKFGFVDFPEKCTYTGEPIELNMYYQNGSFDLETGFLIFVDGIPQEYSINEQDEQSYMHKFDLKAGERRVTKISFQPNTGEKGDVLNLQFASMLEPSYIAKQNEKYGNNHQLLELVPSTLTFETDSENHSLCGYDIENTALMGDEILNRYALTSASAAENHTLNLYGDFGDADVFSKELGKVTLTLEDFGGTNSQYRTTIFVDNTPVKIGENYDYLDYYLKEGYYISEQIDIPVDNSAEKHSVYAISVPTETSSSGTICISDSSTIFPMGTEEISENQTVPEQIESNTNTVISSGGNELTKFFEGTISFIQKIGGYIYTVEDFSRITKYSPDFEKISVKDFDEDMLFLEARALENGVAVFLQPENGTGLTCAVFDSELNAKLTDVYSLVGKDPLEDYISINEIDISPDGSTLICTCYNELGESCIYSYKIASGEKAEIYTDHELGIANVRYTPDGDIAYIADSYASGSRQEFVGIISASGEKSVQQRYSNSEYSGSSSEKVIFDERNVKDGAHSSGKVVVFENGQPTELALNLPDESQHAYISPSGEYILTYLMQNDSCNFTVYNNGKSIAEWSADYSKSSNVNVSYLSFIDDRSVIVAYSVGTEQQVFRYKY